MRNDENESVLAALGGPAIFFDDLPTGLTYRQLGRNMNIVRFRLSLKHIEISRRYIDLKSNI
jgi:hypothetical protein